MKIVLLCLLALAMGTHVLQHFEKDITAIKGYYSSGETSKVYSIFMKMLVQSKTLYEELDIIHPKINEAPAEGNC